MIIIMATTALRISSVPSPTPSLSSPFNKNSIFQLKGRKPISKISAIYSQNGSCSDQLDAAASTPRFSELKLQLLDGLTPNIRTAAIRGRGCISDCTSQKWATHSTAQTQTIVLGDEERKMWEACRQTLSAFNFSDKEEDKTLGKAFGQIHSPYWGEDRAKEVPKFETVNKILDYLRSLGLSDDDLGKLLKKFPEVLGCSLEEELMTNVGALEKEWGIKGKSLRSLLLRNPKVLGYNVDCKGDCMAKCTRCWVRF